MALKYATETEFCHFCSQPANSCFAKWNENSIPHCTRDSPREPEEHISPLSPLPEAYLAGKSSNLSSSSVAPDRVSRNILFLTLKTVKTPAVYFIFLTSLNKSCSLKKGRLFSCKATRLSYDESNT